MTDLIAQVEECCPRKSEESTLQSRRNLCKEGHLKDDGPARAIAWCSLTIGSDEAPPVPDLTEGVIRQSLEKRRSFVLTAGCSSGDGDGDNELSRTERSGATQLRKGGSSTSEADSRNCSGVRMEPETPASLRSSFSTRPSERRHRMSIHNSSSSGEPPFDDVATLRPRRRAVSQLSRRVKGDAAQLQETMGLLPLGSTSADSKPSYRLYPMAWHHLPRNCQPRVVDADIERALWRLYTDAVERALMRRQLRNMLLRILLHNPSRYYYQGLHELMGFVLYALAPHLPLEEIVCVCDRLLCTRWKVFSEEKLKYSEALLYAMHAVVAKVDPILAEQIESCGVGPESHYAVSWVITWYSHCIGSVQTLLRLFDYFIAADENGYAVLYFTAALVVSQREQVLAWIQAALDSTKAMDDSDDKLLLMAGVYSKLSKLPANRLEHMPLEEVEVLIQNAEKYRQQYPDLIQMEQLNFLRGDVKKLGMLANKSTRNAALRLLWGCLPREWRDPVETGRLGKAPRVATIVIGIAVLVMGIALSQRSRLLYVD